MFLISTYREDVATDYRYDLLMILVTIPVANEKYGYQYTLMPLLFFCREDISRDVATPPIIDSSIIEDFHFNLQVLRYHLLMMVSVPVTNEKYAYWWFINALMTYIFF